MRQARSQVRERGLIEQEGTRELLAKSASLPAPEAGCIKKDLSQIEKTTSRCPSTTKKKKKERECKSSCRGRNRIRRWFCFFFEDAGGLLYMDTRELSSSLLSSSSFLRGGGKGGGKRRAPRCISHSAALPVPGALEGAPRGGVHPYDLSKNTINHIRPHSQITKIPRQKFRHLIQTLPPGLKKSPFPYLSLPNPYQHKPLPKAPPHPFPQKNKTIYQACFEQASERDTEGTNCLSLERK